MKVYAKDSMDRFGDDLTEEVLQYLTFEDKLSLECVSKQWQRCVYQRQYVIEIHDFEDEYSDEMEIESDSDEKHNSLDKLLIFKYYRRQLNINAFESVVKKCPNIKKVILRFEIDSSVLLMIGRLCPHIKSLGYRRIGYSMSGNNTNDFFRDNGHKLEELSVTQTNDSLFEYLQYCPNLKTVSIDNINFLFNGDKEFLIKLEKIKSVIPMSSFPFSIQFSKLINEMKILSDKYSKTMKTLNIRLFNLTAEELKTCIECIARFENLKELKVSISPIDITQPIDDCLSLIGQKCTKLLKLDLSISMNELIPITDRFFASFSEFKAIKKLKILFDNHNIKINGNVKAFKDCKQLNEMNINYPKLTEDFFTNIDLFVPKLQSLKISSDEEFSDSFIESFHSMKNIQKVFVSINRNRIHETKYWYFGKSLSEVILSPKGKNVIRVNDNCGLIIDEVITDIENESNSDTNSDNYKNYNFYSYHYGNSDSDSDSDSYNYHYYYYGYDDTDSD